MRQADARKANHDEVVEEDKKMKLPKNFESRKRCAEWELENDARKKVVRDTRWVRAHTQKAEEEGKDFQRVKAMTMTVDEQEARKPKKTNPDQGFAGVDAHCEAG